MNNGHSEKIYLLQIEKNKAQLELLQKKRSRLGWFRLLVFLLTAFIAYNTFIVFGLAGIAVVVTGIGLLLAIVSVDITNNRLIANTKILITINEEELSVLNENYKDRYDGKIFNDNAHPYANDLDLFGSSSLFQYVNRGYTEQGMELLATNLKYPLLLADIYKRHQAVQELSPEYEWRQQFQAYAMQSKLTINTQQRIINWLKEEERNFTKPVWKIIVPVWTILTLSSTIAAILGYLPASIYSFLFLLYVIISGALVSRGAKDYMDLTGIIKEINTLFNLINCIEKKSFKADLLTSLKEQTKANNNNASEQIKKLEKILNRFDLLLNMIASIFLNGFLLWGVRQIQDLNTWRRSNKEVVTSWFNLIANFEVVNSLSVLHFNQPEWVLPAFTDKHFTFQAEALGHPLIPSVSRVVNNFNLEGVGKIGLITGSNMAGKSTFLRSLGVNIILAEMGAPVCAKTFQLSPVRLMSSMRIADNLSENTSTFYAELKKLKTIIDAVNRKEIVFILLDEILRGTNSLDRHTGSQALISQLIRKDAVAVIATHDLELASLQQEFANGIENYHFDVQVEGEELYFDYKLKTGVCTSLNASILMKKIGIDLSSTN